MNGLGAWLRGFIPAPMNAGKRERLYACMGAGAGLMFTAWISKLALGHANPWLIAPMGSSAVLLFAAPSSPLAQPWSVVGGNLVSALIGIVCAKYVMDPALAPSIAVAAAIGAMFALRCLHPPGGAVALTTALGGSAAHASGYGFVLWPVIVNSAFLLLAALVFNNLLRRRYPHPVVQHANPHRTADPLPTQRLGFTRADIDQALKEHHELLDVNEDDLEEIFLHAEQFAYRRRFGAIACADIMSKNVVTASRSMSSDEVWRLLTAHKIKAAPVVDDAGALIGIVTLHDFIVRHDGDGAVDSRLPQLRHAQPVENIMTRDPKTAHAGQPVMELVPLFSDRGFHHLPVIDAQRRVIGMVTQSDLIPALYRARLEEAAA